MKSVEYKKARGRLKIESDNLFFLEIYFPLAYYGFTTAFPSRMTAVCARALPLIDAPV